MNIRKPFILIVFGIIIYSCSEPSIPYSFFVAGHVYGAPNTPLMGAHPPFKEKFGLIKSTPNMQFGVLTGDMVVGSTKERWDKLEADLDELNLTIRHAVGNHEVDKYREYYEDRFGITYNSFILNQDLFIFLDPLLGEGWNIEGEQLDFFKKELDQVQGIENVFIFFHQLLWWQPEGKLLKSNPNSISGRKGKCNFWDEIVPMLEETKIPIFLFAGDLGAYKNGRSCFYHQHKNITMMASGMGGGKKDNFLIVKVDKWKNVEVEMISLNGEGIHALGEIKDCTLN